MERLLPVLTHLNDLFANGVRTVHVDDEMSDGSKLSDAIRAILDDPQDTDEDVIAALDTIQGVWDSGYDMADRDDFATDDRTIGRIVEEYLEASEDPSP